MERRAVYRQVPDPAYLLGMAVCHADGEVFADEIVDINSVGARSRFELDRAPRLSVGSRVCIVFTGRLLRNPIELEATVVSSDDMHNHRYFSFRFDLNGYAHGQDWEFFQIFNRRHSERD